MYSDIIKKIDYINFLAYFNQAHTEIPTVMKMISAYNAEYNTKHELIYNPFSNKYTLE